MTTEIYDVDYFIKKFEGIPEDQIGADGLHNQCANWHLGVRWYSPDEITPEVRALADLFKPFVPPRCRSTSTDAFERVYTINDGNRGCGRFGNTPKSRLLNALKEVKEGAAK